MSAVDPTTPLLVADIGGTHVRTAVTEEERLTRRRSLTCRTEDELVAALEDAVASSPLVRRAVLAVAGPVIGRRIRFTNRDWSFSIDELQQQLGLDSLVVANDLEAVAWGLTAIDRDDLDTVKDGTPDPDSPFGVVGVGTGLGLSIAVPHDDDWAVAATEGGHRDLAAATEIEWRLVSILADRHGHVSAERALSGSGIVELYRALAALEGVSAVEVTDAVEIDALARSGDALAQRTLEQFATWLGAFAADLALTAGVRGGIYLTGGVLPRMGELFDRELFADRFVAKGRFDTYVRPIPVWLVTDVDIALFGCARMGERYRTDR